MPKRVGILGSTGSIGQNAIRVIEALGPEYEITALSANSSVELLTEQVKRFQPKMTAITNPDYGDLFKSSLNGYPGKIYCGAEGLLEIAASDQVDVVLFAVVGAAGLPAILAAAREGKILAIANKEPLVIAGQLLTEQAKTYGSTILPIDSEHSAVFQSLLAGKRQEVKRIILTASGGPFRTMSKEQMDQATVEQALDHPTWKMGPKITVDSASMMNKALEVIEAKWLFDLPVEKIDVVIHPQSVIHSMVEFVDGSVIAQLGTADMKTPIQYALTYPERRQGIAEGLKLEEMGQLTFEKPDLEKFRALALGFEAAKIGGSVPVVFNAANEAAVAAFLDGKIRFGKIVELIEYCIENHQPQKRLDLEQLLEADQWARRKINERLDCIETSL